MECVYNMFEGMGQRPTGNPKVKKSLKPYCESDYDTP